MRKYNLNNFFTIYRYPVVLTVVMLASLFAWSFHAWKEIVDRSHSRQKLRFDVAASNLQIIDKYCALKNEAISKVIENSIQNSLFSFFMIDQDGKVIIEIGTTPMKLHANSPEGEVFDGKMAMYWKTLKTESIGNTKLIMGGSMENDRGYHVQLQNLVITVFLAFLLISVNFVAWIMVIRSRILGEQLEKQKARSAYLEDLELAAAGLAHETKNPLGIISGISQQIASTPDIKDSTKLMIEDIIDEVDKAASRLGHFLNFARHREIRISSLDLNRTIRKIASIMQAEFDSDHVGLEIQCPEISVMADEEMLRQILVNILLNSLHASSDGGAVKVAVCATSDSAEIKIEDNGCGISQAMMPNIFKPYVAGTPDGHGLGLAIVKRLAEAHGWVIRAESSEGRGTVMIINGIKTLGQN